MYTVFNLNIGRKISEIKEGDLFFLLKTIIRNNKIIENKISWYSTHSSTNNIN